MIQSFRPPRNIISAFPTFMRDCCIWRTYPTFCTCLEQKHDSPDQRLSRIAEWLYCTAFAVYRKRDHHKCERWFANSPSEEKILDTKFLVFAVKEEEEEEY